MDLTAIHCRSIFLNTRLIEGLYKRFAHVFDAGDDQLVRDRFLTLHYASCFMLFTTAVLVPCIAIGVCGYLYKVQWLYALAISLFILPFIWRLIYRWYILSASSSFVYSTRNFDSCLNSVITAIREREVISFGVLVNSAGEFHCCNRVLRTELLNSLRSFVRAYMNASEKIALSEEKGKLLRSFFTEAMTQLALNDEVIDRFLHLPSLKELFKLLSLVRSEYIRLTLFRLTEVDAYGGLKVIYSLRKFKKMQNKFRKRPAVQFTSALKYVFVEEDDDLVGSQPNKSRPPASTRERAVVELGLALQILKKSDSDENKKKATGILYDVIEMISPKKDKKKDEEVKKVENSNEQTERSFERSSFDGDKVYEGISERMEECEGSKAAFYTASLFNF
uniref:PXA domain-containing protein n=1 Tax=Syphacia muris TaxID=451379 RepID=A0A0N5A8R8_9BILA